MSIEALAMAGADYMECGIDLLGWETGGSTQAPPYLLVEKIPGIEAGTNCNDDKQKANEERAKAKMREWAKAVAAMNRSLIQSEFRNERCILIKQCTQSYVANIFD